MTTSNELQTLATVTTEIDESESKLTYAKQCIKAKEELSNKLRSEIERRKEVCNFQKNGNLKLQAEIQNAEHEIQNLIITHNAITLANTDTKRELLLAKENNMSLVERMGNAENKYENIWIESKKRYENIPIVQKLIQTTKKSEVLQVDIDVVENEIKVLNTEFKIRKADLINTDRKHIIQLVQFIVHEIPLAIKLLKEKSMEAETLTVQINSIIKGQETNHNKNLSGTMARLNLHQYEDNNKAGNCSKVKNNDDDTFMMPRLQLPTFEIDIRSVKLEINKVDFRLAPVKRTMSANKMQTISIKRGKDDDLINNYVSCYFKLTENLDDMENKKHEDFSKRKLINILDDVKLDEQETYKIISKVNMDKCQGVDVITADNARNNSPPEQTKVDTLSATEEIEEIDISKTNDENVLVPPSQFLDLTQGKGLGGYQPEVDVIVHMAMDDTSSTNGNLAQIKSSQEDVIKKRVSFDIPTMSQCEVTEVIENEITSNNKGDQITGIVANQFDLSIGDDKFSSIKDMILKKHNLDLSPQFVYGKNMAMLQKKTEANIVTSKFFKSNTKHVETDEVAMEIKDDQVNKLGLHENNSKEKPQAQLYENIQDKRNLVDKVEEPVTGLLFTHGPQGIIDGLDLSMSTTGYEEGDAGFPTGLDSSLLLSPKADTSANNVDVGSQELPNFLYGTRKAGISFFKQNEISGNNTNNSEQNGENNFSFNFASEDKKNKGGIFSFFR